MPLRGGEYVTVKVTSFVAHTRVAEIWMLLARKYPAFDAGHGIDSGPTITGHARERLFQDRVLSRISRKAQWWADFLRQSTGEALIPGHQ